MNLLQRVVVIGAGTMGAGIAAHLANAGCTVTLLDVAPAELSPEEESKGLTLQDRAVRNRIAQQGLDRVVKSRPAQFFTAGHAARVKVGNLTDDLGAISEADWVIEAVVEDLDVKRNLMERIDALRSPHTVVSTNTSGIGIAQIAEGRSAEFLRHFLGVHFFNPPRYLKLVEVIPTGDTLPEVVEQVTRVVEGRLGKGVVLAKDTPNFIANRIGQVSGAFLIDYALRNGYTVKEVDTLTGPLLGRPSTGIFRLLDLIGIDVWEATRCHLTAALGHDPAAVKVLSSPWADALFQAMVASGKLGNKTKQGFYKQVRSAEGKKEYWELNLETLEYQPPSRAEFPSLDAVKNLKSLTERLEALLAGEDRGARLVQAEIYHLLAYASHCIPEIADSPLPVDQALKWGFGHKAGPFELWDALGVEKIARQMAAAGYPPAGWVDEMLAAGYTSFYQTDGDFRSGVYRPDRKDYQPIFRQPGAVRLSDERRAGRVIRENGSASLIDLRDGVACVELHPPFGAIDLASIDLLSEALDRLEDRFEALLICARMPDFSIGTNLMPIASAAQEGNWAEIEDFIRRAQQIHQRIRYSARPVVVAAAGKVLGLGAELLLHAAQVVAGCELYTGFIDVAAGVNPAAGGTKELLRRVVNPPMSLPSPDPLVYLQAAFERLAFAKVSSSADDALQMGYLRPGDRVVMNPDRILAVARRQALGLAEAGYRPPLPEKIYAAGRDALAGLRVAIFTIRESGMITEYESCLAEKLAVLLTGGEISRPAWVDEQYFLDLERETFLSLCGQPQTQARMWSLIQTGKPLRN